MPYAQYRFSNELNSSFFKSSAPSFFWEKFHGKNDIHRSIFISRKFLSIIRVFFAIYFAFSLLLMILTTQNPWTFLQLSRWSFLVQAVYFIQAARRSLNGRSMSQVDDQSDWKMIHICYEVAFSFQLSNFVYYIWNLCFGVAGLGTSKLDFYIEIQAHIVSFVIIWCDQLFNLLRLYLRHIWLIVIIGAVNLGWNYLLSCTVGSFIYYEMNFGIKESVFMGLLFIVLPTIHFIVGYYHYEYKHRARNNKIKLLKEHLVALKKVHDGGLPLSRQQ